MYTSINISVNYHQLNDIIAKIKDSPKGDVFYQVAELEKISEELYKLSDSLGECIKTTVEYKF